MTFSLRQSTDVRAELFDRDLLRSLALIGVVVTMACIALVVDGNWPKLLRVSTAAGSYIGILAMFRTWRHRAHPGSRLGYGSFLIAGLIAGAVSGSVRPEFVPALFITQIFAGGILVSAVHWTALVRWRGLRRLVFPEEVYES